MRIFRSSIVAAALALAAPAWAHGGHGYDGGRHGWNEYRHPPAWGHRHHGHHYRHGYWVPYSRYSYNYYYPAYSAYGYAAPAPGVHIVVPNIYIPLR